MTGRAFLILWLLLSSSFVGYNGLRTIYIGRMILPHSQAVALSLVIVIVLTVLLLGAWLLLAALAARLRWIRGTPWVRRPRVQWSVVGLLLLGGLLLVYGRFIEPCWLAVREVHLGDSRGLPEGPVRIAVISDLHLDHMREPFTSLAEQVNRTDPDLVLFLGDMLNHARALPFVREVIGPIRARHGKLAVRGNWESWYWKELPLLEGTGFRWIDNERRTLRIRGQTLHLVGFHYQDRYPVGRAIDLLEGSRQGWRVLLYHTPDIAMDLPDSADLILAGHTHGGQVALPGFGALVTLSMYGKRFERGLSRQGKTLVYVNPGIGVEPILPIRLGVRPEITLLLLGQAPHRATYKDSDLKKN